MIYDAILWVSFGGPEKKEDVIPFLENVLRGKNVPRERMMSVAEHYYQFGGRSPINEQNRRLIAALEAELAKNGPRLPIYWGNRNWHPMLTDTVAKMKADGIRRALAFVTSAYSSYSSCRQYLEDIVRAQAGAEFPVVDKIRAYFNHPDFIEALQGQVREALGQLPPERRASAHVVYTAHSIPLSMAEHCNYAGQLLEVCRLVSAALGREQGPLVYQSRSGPPHQPWLGPDILDHLREIRNRNRAKDVVVAPVGFVSDHMEIVYDLDTQARSLCGDLGLNMVRAAAVGNHPRFIPMVRELILERMDGASARGCLGTLGLSPDICQPNCCRFQSSEKTAV